MTTFSNAADKAIYDKLVAASALTTLLADGASGVYRSLAPDGANAPYVVFQAQSPSVPVRVLGGVAYENALYAVKGVTESHSAAAAGTIANQINAALDGPPLTYTGRNHVRCSREQDIDFEEHGPGGARFQHRGAVYRVQASTS